MRDTGPKMTRRDTGPKDNEGHRTKRTIRDRGPKDNEERKEPSMV